MRAAPRSRLIVVSNRLPLKVERTGPAECHVSPGTGGLVSAMAPVMRARGGVWIGWPGTSGNDELLRKEFRRAGQREGYRFEPVFLTREERDAFYYGFSNEVVWPLFHDLQSLCRFDPAYWRGYLAVNRRYADVIAKKTTHADFIWVHDYQLMGVGRALRDLGHEACCAFFLHIPFPSPDIFGKLPWRESVLRSLFAYDLVGFQTRRDRRNFLDCIDQFLPDAEVSGRGQSLVRLRLGERESRAGWFPIGIDHNDFYRRANSPEVVRRAHDLSRLLPDRHLILGIDRLDYTKGIPERLCAFRNALERYPDLHERVTLIQIVVPSRADIPQYQELKSRIENLVGEINGRFTRPGGWVPIHYVFRALEPNDLLAFYHACQIALITPLKDGMNLVAKEYCACDPDENGVLILSEFAGAAVQMASGALLVNPCDIEAVADTLHTAFLMSGSERRARMRRLRRGIRRQDVFWWVDTFMSAATGAITAARPTHAGRPSHAVQPRSATPRPH